MPTRIEMAKNNTKIADFDEREFAELVAEASASCIQDGMDPAVFPQHLALHAIEEVYGKRLTRLACGVLDYLDHQPRAKKKWDDRYKVLECTLKLWGLTAKATAFVYQLNQGKSPEEVAEFFGEHFVARWSGE